LTQITEKETDLQILTNKPADKNFLQERINLYRWQIENYISRERKFLTSLKPICVELNAPPIVKEMTKQARKANVGPMAAVAGAIAEFLGRDLLRKGYQEVIIENGGDIFLKTTKTRKIGIYAGRSKLWQGLGLKIKAKETPLGVCTSSGSVGHSLSFGRADSVVVLAKNTALADAVATACGNRVQSARDLQGAVDFARAIPGIRGVAIILKKQLISWGELQFAQ